MTDYCSARDVYAFGIPPGAVSEEARLVPGGADVTANTLSLDNHGFETDDPLQVREDGVGGAMPAPLVEGTPYYAKPVDQHAFQLAAAPGGAAIDLTTTGGRLRVVAPLPIAQACAWASRILDDMLPAHVVPFDALAIPELVRMTAAELAAWKLTSRAGSSSVALSEMLKEARARLDRWAKNHVPVRGETDAPRASLAVVSATRRDVAGWRRFGV